MLNFTRSLLVHSSSLSRSLWMVSCPGAYQVVSTVWCHLHTWWVCTLLPPPGHMLNDKSINKDKLHTDPCSPTLLWSSKERPMIFLGLNIQLAFYQWSILPDHHVSTWIQEYLEDRFVRYGSSLVDMCFLGTFPVTLFSSTWPDMWFKITYSMISLGPKLYLSRLHFSGLVFCLFLKTSKSLACLQALQTSPCIHDLPNIMVLEWHEPTLSPPSWMQLEPDNWSKRCQTDLIVLGSAKSYCTPKVAKNGLFFPTGELF